MSIWAKIAEAISQLAKGESLASVFERLKTPPERSVAFAIAVIALGAKMAKADGQVTRDEVAAFREVFHIPEQDKAKAAHVFNLARQDVAGFDAYARSIAQMFGEEHPALLDLMEGLFYIAVADGIYHPGEDAFLKEVAAIFSIPEPSFAGLRARFVPGAERDPYEVLGVTPQMTVSDIRKAWRQLVRDTHPDQMMARGVPEEAVRMATKKLADINRAWEQISRQAA